MKKKVKGVRKTTGRKLLEEISGEITFVEPKNESYLRIVIKDQPDELRWNLERPASLRGGDFIRGFCKLNEATQQNHRELRAYEILQGDNVIYRDIDHTYFWIEENEHATQT